MKKLILALIFLLNVTLSFGEAKVFVLAFHTFLGKETVDLDIDTKKFKDELQKLKNDGFTFVSMEQIIENKITGNKNLLMTIDDGHKTVIKAFDEVLKPMGIKPVLAIYPSIIGNSKSFMTWDEVNRLAKEGAYIAAHGYKHLHVNQKLFDKNKKEFEDEIYKSKQILEEKTGKKIDTFVYPYGIRSDITKEYLKKAGYKRAFTINWGTLLLPLNLNKDNFELPRYMFTRKEWDNEVKIIKSKAK